MSDAQQPITFYRKDYRPPNHRIIDTALHFRLEPNRTLVTSTLKFERWNDETQAQAPLELDGEELELLEISLNGQALAPEHYTQTAAGLNISNPGDQGELKLVVVIYPEQNTRLEGLYVSNSNFFTQCEAQGFRRITYFPDRPDVLSRFTVTLEHNPATHPVALSNGNLLDQSELEDGWQQTRWEDPFYKPSYLFALVAGQFECQEETIERSTAKPALLQVWVEPGNLDKTDFAMQSLKRSVQWDRERFNLELDLDRFMIVATADFNMGAMENKGLNIFNTRFVFANPQLATDFDFEHVESVVGHEYFHNWTGNRVTCRDWFQLSLKEGLTVFRDQEFTGDMLAHGLDADQAASARAVKRINDVKALRAIQFPEDAGPMAHPIRPDSYQEINNFYSITVYEKGAEVIRMQHTLLGEQTFQRGMQIYFERFDGQAVTCDDFVDCMEKALTEQSPGRNLKQFRHWYTQAGTPTVQANWNYNPDQQSLTLRLSQHCTPTPGQASKPAFHIPVRLGLVGPSGEDVALVLTQGSDRLNADVLNLTQAKEEFEFSQVPEGTIPSLMRGFSAPVRLNTTHTLTEIQHLALHDTDPFNRWDAAQTVYAQAILCIMNNMGKTDSDLVHAANEVFGANLSNAALSDGYKALCLDLPSEGELSELAEGQVDPVALHQAKRTLGDLLAAHFTDELQAIYSERHRAQPYAYNAIEVGERSLKNCVLGYLTAPGKAAELAQKQFDQAQHMTDRMAALKHLVHNGCDAQAALLDYFEQFKHEALAIDKWFSVQATQPASANPKAIENITALLTHSEFSIKNPNRARSVLAALAMQNPSVFHHPDGLGYNLWADRVIELNGINPQVAARMARALDRWAKLVPNLQTHAKTALERILKTPNLSTDVQEIVGKALGQ